MPITIKPIKTNKDHKEALECIEKLMSRSADLQTEERETLNVLATLVQEYEAKKFPSKLPDPVTAIKFRMEQEGLAQKDLVPYIGSRGRVSEILSGKRSLTLEMIRKLSDGLGIPLKSFVGTSCKM